MGFIDWHKNKKDHYEDVLDYARGRREEEQRLERDRQIRREMGALLGDEGYAAMQSRDAVRRLSYEYQTLKKAYTARLRAGEGGADPAMLWQDLWTQTADGMLLRQGIAPEKRAALLQALQDKVFALHAPLSAQRFIEEKEKNRRFNGYLERCFDLHGDAHFWRFACKACGGRQAAELFDGYRRLRLLLAYDLYLCGEPGAAWMKQMQDEEGQLDQMRRRIAQGACGETEARRLKNPLFMKKPAGLDELARRARVILFRLKKRTKAAEGEMNVVEELYIALDDGTLTFERIESILPEEAKAQIAKNELPVFPDLQLKELEEQEQLLYLDHGELYRGKERDGETVFRADKGAVYFTDRRILLRCGGMIELPYDSIARVIQYDLLPQLLEVVSGNQSYFLRLPDVESAYRALRLIANRNRGQQVNTQAMPFAYEELVDKADLGACVFAFEYVAAGGVPRALEALIAALTPKLRCLEKTVTHYPDKKAGIDQFLHYYVPEAVRVCAQYQHYQAVELDKKTLESVYEKVMDALGALDGAVTKKIAEIYGFAAMDTIAQAEALREILGQDGFADPSCMIR